MAKRKRARAPEEEVMTEMASDDGPPDEPAEDHVIDVLDLTDGGELKPEALDGLPVEVERLSVVNESTATEMQRAQIQAAFTRIASRDWDSANDVRALRELFFGDAELTT